MRPSRPAAFAVLVGSLASVGCLNPGQQKEPLALGQDTRSVLTAPGGGGAKAAQTAKPATFDPTATGGSGLSVQNSFNRTTPGAGTGTSTGNFVSKLPPPQVGLPPPVGVPAVQGASYGEPMTEPGRSSMPRAATPPPLPGGGQFEMGANAAKPLSPAPPVPPTDASPFGPNPPKLDPPLNDPPPPRPIPTLPAPDTSGPIRPVMPDLDRVPTQTPTTSAPIAPGAPIPPAPPGTPGAAANEPLPLMPAPPTYVPSPVEAPIPGVQAPPKLPPAPPIRPQ